MNKIFNHLQSALPMANKVLEFQRKTFAVDKLIEDISISFIEQLDTHISTSFDTTFAYGREYIVYKQPEVYADTPVFTIEHLQDAVSVVLNTLKVNGFNFEYYYIGENKNQVPMYKSLVKIRVNWDIEKKHLKPYDYQQR
jgi:hypothetical protein